MRRIVRVILWIVKGVLLAIALGALILWPWSDDHWGWISLSKSELRVDRIEFKGSMLRWGAGRIAVGDWRGHWKGLKLGDVRADRPYYRTGWNGCIESGMPGTLTPRTDHPWHPFAYDQVIEFDPPLVYNDRSTLFPLWLIALSASAWPLTSLTLLYRRRVRRRRRARIGCCAACGYDVRATPHAGGELLKKCPECGTQCARKPTA